MYYDEFIGARTDILNNVIEDKIVIGSSMTERSELWKKY
jgi:hypothetical protein